MVCFTFCRNRALKYYADEFPVFKEFIDVFINMYINQQDAQISVIKLYFLIRCSTCFGLY